MDQFAPPEPADLRGRSCSSTSGPTPASTGCGRFHTFARGHRSTRRDLSWSACTRRIRIGTRHRECPSCDRRWGSTIQSRSTTTTRSGAPSRTSIGRRCTLLMRAGGFAASVWRGRLRTLREGDPAAAGGSGRAGSGSGLVSVQASWPGSAGCLGGPEVCRELYRDTNARRISLAGRHETDQRRRYRHRRDWR